MAETTALHWDRVLSVKAVTTTPVQVRYKSLKEIPWKRKQLADASYEICFQFIIDEEESCKQFDFFYCKPVDP